MFTVQGGITVVVSPLISLIQDQVTKLNGINISADHLSGDDYARYIRVSWEKWAVILDCKSCWYQNFYGYVLSFVGFYL